MNKTLNKNELLSLIQTKPLPTHIAIIMDGNGRWAIKQGMPRNYGHQKGAKVLYEIIKECQKLEIKCLSVFAFSTENWKRPKDEVDFIFNELKKFHDEHHDELVKLKINVNIIGEKDRLDVDTINLINEINHTKHADSKFTLNIAFNYGAKQELVNVCQQIAIEVKTNKIKVSDIDSKIIENHLYTRNLPDVDLLIRTSGEMRISNFLLWQMAYSEMYFTKTYWPDFHSKELYLAIYEYQNRGRRFGDIK